MFSRADDTTVLYTVTSDHLLTRYLVRISSIKSKTTNCILITRVVISNVTPVVTVYLQDSQ